MNIQYFFKFDLKVCIICREEMLAPSTKKLPCNHIFHKSCLRSWFQRQQTCPTCRLDVLRAPLPNQVNTRVAGLAAAVAAAAQRVQPPVGRDQGNTQNANGQVPQPNAPIAGQNQPPFPPFDPNIFAQMINNARMGIPQPTPVNQANGAAVNATSNAQTSSNSNLSPPTLMNNNPFAPPPLPSFAFAPPPFGIPPPMPPPNFSGLTTEELRTMEGNERENIEARVKCLRNVQVLLDAAVMEMQQYTLVVSRLNTTSTDSKNLPDKNDSAKNDKNTSNPIPSDDNSLVLNSSSKENIKYKTPEETGAKPKVKQALSISEREQEKIIAKMDEGVKLEKKPLKEQNSPSEETKETDELRRRRLEKFSPKNGSNN